MCKKIKTLSSDVLGVHVTDSLYPERLQNGLYFIPFPKPQRYKKKFAIWIRLWQARIPTDFKLVTFCKYFKDLN